MNGYIACACRDCFELAIGVSPDLCWECEEADCSIEGDSECAVAPDTDDNHNGGE